MQTQKFYLKQPKEKYLCLLCGDYYELGEIIPGKGCIYCLSRENNKSSTAKIDFSNIKPN